MTEDSVDTGYTQRTFSEVILTCFTVTAHEADGAAALVTVVDDAAGPVIQTWLTGHAFIDLDLTVST